MMNTERRCVQGRGKSHAAISWWGPSEPIRWVSRCGRVLRGKREPVGTRPTCQVCLKILERIEEAERDRLQEIGRFLDVKFLEKAERDRDSQD